MEHETSDQSMSGHPNWALQLKLLDAAGLKSAGKDDFPVQNQDSIGGNAHDIFEEHKNE